jgi:hypothetical protein
MVLRGPGDDGGLWLIAISTVFDRPNTNKYWVECEWAPEGHPLTGLNRPCVLKCDWVVRFNRDKLIDYLGRLDDYTAKRARDLALDFKLTANQNKTK